MLTCSASKEMCLNLATLCSVRRNSRDVCLLLFVQHPVHTGSALEVGHLVRVQTLESQLDYKVDKKTIRRTIDKMAAENILTLHHEPASETFQRICGRNVQVWISDRVSWTFVRRSFM